MTFLLHPLNSVITRSSILSFLFSYFSLHFSSVVSSIPKLQLTLYRSFLYTEFYYNNLLNIIFFGSKQTHKTNLHTTISPENSVTGWLLEVAEFSLLSTTESISESIQCFHLLKLCFLFFILKSSYKFL